MTKRNPDKEEAQMELIANLAVAIICGLAVAAFFTFASFRYYPVRNSGVKICGIALAGFILGSGYGFWHAVRGWKRNDAQKAHDDEFNIF
jgi:hypothetical protein